jgi:hypothetical protein
LYRTVVLILVFVAVVFFAVRQADEPVRAIQRPEVHPAPEVLEKAGGPQGRDAPVQTPDADDLKIGDFEAPEHIPDYDILEESPDERDGARAARLLVDTRSREEEDFVLIARDLKSRYSDYDAVSVEFTDTEDVLFYNDDPVTRDLLKYYGGALIFNTYDGADYLGYIYGPPNMEGYYVKAVE